MLVRIREGLGGRLAAAAGFALHLLVAVAVLAFGAACEEVVPPELHAEVHSVRLSVDTFVVTVDEAGTVTGGPITIGVGAAGLGAQFLDAAAEIVPIAPAEYRLEVAPADAGVATFARQVAFAGTLTGVTAGSTQLAVCLFHIEEDHCDFGSLTVPVVPVMVEEPPAP